VKNVFWDDFNDNYLDPNKWEAIVETGGSIMERNQRLEFIMPRYPNTGTYKAFVVSVASENVNGEEILSTMCLGGCTGVDVKVGNEKVAKGNPTNYYMVRLVSMYDPDNPSVGDIVLRVFRKSPSGSQYLYDKVIGSYPAGKNMTVRARMVFKYGKASFYADWGAGEKFLAEENYALPSLENYFYMRADSSDQRYGTAWFDDVGAPQLPKVTVAAILSPSIFGTTLFTYSAYKFKR
jgi:hypothetical protein